MKLGNKKLNEYLIKNQITTQQFSNQLKCSNSLVSKWRNGERKPGWPKMMAKVIKATKGSVTEDDWKRDI